MPALGTIRPFLGRSGFARATDDGASTLLSRSAKTTHVVPGARVQCRPEQIGQCALRHSCLTQNQILALYQLSSGRRSDYPRFSHLASTAPSGFLRATGRHGASYGHGCFGAEDRVAALTRKCRLTMRFDDPKGPGWPPLGCLALRCLTPCVGRILRALHPNVTIRGIGQTPTGHGLVDGQHPTCASLPRNRPPRRPVHTRTLLVAKSLA